MKEMFIFIIILLTIMGNNFMLDHFSENSKPLFDLIHYVTPSRLKDYGYVSDTMTIMLLLYTFIELYTNDLRFRDVNLKYFRKCLVLCHFLKKLIGILTILPDPSGICAEKPLPLILGRCNDLSVSGHASSCILCYLFLREYGRRDFLFVYVVMTCIAIIISRNHYSVDVIFAYFLTNYIYQNWKYRL